MDQGLLVPDEVTNEMVRERLCSDELAGGVLLDGFPRNVDQADFLAAVLDKRGHSLEAVILMEVETERLVQRLKGRAWKEGRTDDADEAVIRKRLATYLSETAPCIAYYECKGTAVFHIDGDGTMDEVESRILTALVQRV
jgi:adenylate kinase